MAASGEFRVLMAMRAKQGETSALAAVQDPEQLSRVQLLVELDPHGSVNRQRANLATLTTRINELGASPMIDVTELVDDGGHGGGPARVLGELTDRLPADLFTAPSFIPVVRGDSTGEFATFTGRLCDELGAGAALRVRPGVTSAALERVVGDMRLSPAEVDLVLDWRYVTSADDDVAATAAAALRGLDSISGFRSTTLLSGSVPPTMSRTASWEQPRFEETLWQLVREATTPDLRFGDYGVVHPWPRKGYRSHHVSVKYTCPGTWLYLRERMAQDAAPDPDGQDEASRARTLRALCRRLVANDSFSGREFSWGDQEIHSAASGRGVSLGLSSKPVAIGTSHHLAYLGSIAAA